MRPLLSSRLSHGPLENDERTETCRPAQVFESVIAHGGTTGRRAGLRGVSNGSRTHNLGQPLKCRVLPCSFRRVTVATLRWKVYRLAGKLVHHARGWMLQIKADLEKWGLLQSARACCATLRT
jgi:hypothetical protein